MIHIFNEHSLAALLRSCDKYNYHNGCIFFANTENAEDCYKELLENFDNGNLPGVRQLRIHASSAWEIDFFNGSRIEGVCTKYDYRHHDFMFHDILIQEYNEEFEQNQEGGTETALDELLTEFKLKNSI